MFKFKKNNALKECQYGFQNDINRSMRGNLTLKLATNTNPPILAKDCEKYFGELVEKIIFSQVKYLSDIAVTVNESRKVDLFLAFDYKGEDKQHDAKQDFLAVQYNIVKEALSWGHKNFEQKLVIDGPVRIDQLTFKWAKEDEYEL